MGELLFTPFGKTAYLLQIAEAEDSPPEAYARRVAVFLRMAERLRSASSIVEVVPAYDELLVTWTRTARQSLVRDFIARAYASAIGATPERGEIGQHHRLAVLYGGADLAAVAKALGLSAAGVVELHTSVEYRVQAIGFQPGFAYLGALPAALRLPRKSVPLVRVPPGSVAIAGTQTAVYPHASPGGWHLLGRTAIPTFDAFAASLSRLRVGDTVKFLDATQR